MTVFTVGPLALNYGHDHVCIREGLVSFVLFEMFCHHSGHVVQSFAISSGNLVCDLKGQGGR